MSLERLSDTIKNEKILLPGLLLAFMLVGAVVSNPPIPTTSSSNPGYSAGQQSLDMADTSLSTRQDSAEVDTAERKRATRLNLEYEVPDVESAINAIRGRASDFGGYTEDENIRKDLSDSGRITVRVPDGNVSSFVESVESNDWELKSRDTRTDDLTDTYTQLDLELRNKRQELAQLEKIMNRTNKTSELIEVQERMSEVRSRVQYLENRLNDIDRQVDYTRITYDLQEPESFTSEFELDQAFRDSYRGVFQSLNLMIVGAGYLAPFLLLGAFLYYGRRALRDDEEEE